jgi:ubiquinone/menaquinone biosynthesis C-methylase UbiE
MFFPERITKIAATDRVLEVGPGSTPHPRADVLLEKIFEDEAEFRLQRGNTDVLQTDKKIVFYEGDRFPFEDKEFDYVICSHVLEHVTDPQGFLKEIYRIAKKGYIEFPTAYYDFIYDIPVHPIMLVYKQNKIFWLNKNETDIAAFKEFQYFFFETLKKEHYGMINTLREYFVQGIEWESEVECVKAKNIIDVCFDRAELDKIPHCKPKPVSIGLRAEIKRTINRLIKLK